VVEVDTDHLGRQPDVGVGAAVVLLDVRLEVVGVCNRPDMWRQRREGGERHVIAAVSDLRCIVVLRRSHNLGPRLPRRVTDWTLRVVVVFLILGTPLVLDIVALTLLALHDLVDAALGIVLTVVVEAMSQLSLLVFAVTLVDVTAGIVTTPVSIEVDV
jgi:hypothetical protein